MCVPVLVLWFRASFIFFPFYAPPRSCLLKLPFLFHRFTPLASPPHSLSLCALRRIEGGFLFLLISLNRFSSYVGSWYMLLFSLFNGLILLYSKYRALLVLFSRTYLSFLFALWFSSSLFFSHNDNNNNTFFLSYN